LERSAVLAIFAMVQFSSGQACCRARNSAERPVPA
jgi:hypothetical protein